MTYLSCLLLSCSDQSVSSETESSSSNQSTLIDSTEISQNPTNAQQFILSDSLDVNKKNNPQHKQDYIDPNFYRNTKKVTINAKWGVVDNDGNGIFPVKYDFIENYYPTYARVKNNEKWGYINRSGEELIPIIYDEMTTLQYNCVGVRIGNKWGIMDITGKTLIPVKYEDIGYGLTGKKKIVRKPPAKVNLNGKWGIVDSTGQLIITPEYDEIKFISNSLFTGKTKGKWGVIKGIDKEVTPFIYDNIMFYDSTIAVCINDKWGIINHHGDEILPISYDRIKLIRSSIAVCDQDDWGIYDLKGNLLIKPSLKQEDIGNYSDRLAGINSNAFKSRIFTLTPMSYDSLEQGAFIGLSDENLYHPIYIDTEEKDNYAYDYEIYEDVQSGEFKGEKRRKLLKSKGLTENDTIYIYNMFLDTLITLIVNETNLMEKEDPYGGTAIGFVIKNLPLKAMGNFNWNTFVHVGYSNPFQTGNVHPIKWKQVALSHFPKNVKAQNEVGRYDSILRGSVYEFEIESYTYLIQDIEITKERYVGSHLVIKKIDNGSIVHNEIYSKGGRFVSDLIAKYESRLPVNERQKYIKWNYVDNNVFPSDLDNYDKPSWYTKSKKEKTTEFVTASHRFLIQSRLGEYNEIVGRHLIVKPKDGNSLVFNKIYWDSEGTGLSQLISNTENIQWTGQIFKNKPPIVYGFLWVSFGCPWIDFIEGKESSIGILCDNRH